jgi:hypothetical protein
MDGTIKRLQGWYISNCNGEWEHSYGIEIRTSKDDVAAWTVEVTLPGHVEDEGSGATTLSKRQCWVRETRLRRYLTGPRGLTRSILCFLDGHEHCTSIDVCDNDLDSTDPLFKLQSIYASDPSKFHISMGTLDNPGWSIEIECLHNASAEAAWSDQYEHNDDEDDWYSIKWEPPHLRAACGPGRLGSTIDRLLSLLSNILAANDGGLQDV